MKRTYIVRIRRYVGRQNEMLRRYDEFRSLKALKPSATSIRAYRSTGSSRSGGVFDMMDPGRRASMRTLRLKDAHARTQRKSV